MKLAEIAQIASSDQKGRTEQFLRKNLKLSPPSPSVNPSVEPQ
jgi:hypothetical protein